MVADGARAGRPGGAPRGEIGNPPRGCGRPAVAGGGRGRAARRRAMAARRKFDRGGLRQHMLCGVGDVPVFEPSEEEFAAGPYAYLATIREEGARYGLCRVRPPKSFRVPLALSMKTLRFDTRSQPVNELMKREAYVQTEEEFMKEYEAFLEEKGVARWRRPPAYDGEELDLRQLFAEVRRRGGFRSVGRRRMWREVVRAMGVGDERDNAPTVFRALYEKHLLAYEQHCAPGGATADETAVASGGAPPAGPSADGGVAGAAAAGGGGVPSVQPSPAKSAGGKAPAHTHARRVVAEAAAAANARGGASVTGARGQADAVSGAAVLRQGSSARGPGCSDANARDIVASSGLRGGTEAWGFEDGGEYTATELQESNRAFMSRYFGSDSRARSLSVHEIEAEFWRCVESPDHTVRVLYGADLDTHVVGSGFPVAEEVRKRFKSEDMPPPPPHLRAPGTRGGAPSPATAACASSAWNLNNIPFDTQSMLNFIEQRVQGIMVPWLYLGMCFSSFAWHTEDHHLYSINYNHVGAPKVWYTVPASSREGLERVMRDVLPDMFDAHPDLLFQLTTLVNPAQLEAAGVPVYRCVQHAGEFVFAFPGAYHGGFNAGFNVAEAVNFGAADWIPSGVQATARIAKFHRPGLFCQEEVAARAAQRQAAFHRRYLSRPGRKKRVTPTLFPREAAETVARELLRVHRQESEARRDVLQAGCAPEPRNAAARENASINGAAKRGSARRRGRVLAPTAGGAAAGDGDEHECIVCRRFVFASAVGCSCCPGRAACPMHADKLCDCAPGKRALISGGAAHLRALRENASTLADAMHDESGEASAELQSHLRALSEFESTRNGAERWLEEAQALLDSRPGAGARPRDPRRLVGLTDSLAERMDTHIVACGALLCAGFEPRDDECSEDGSGGETSDGDESCSIQLGDEVRARYAQLCKAAAWRKEAVAFMLPHTRTQGSAASQTRRTRSVVAGGDGMEKLARKVRTAAADHACSGTCPGRDCADGSTSAAGGTREGYVAVRNGFAPGDRVGEVPTVERVQRLIADGDLGGPGEVFGHSMLKMLRDMHAAEVELDTIVCQVMSAAESSGSLDETSSSPLASHIGPGDKPIDALSTLAARVGASRVRLKSGSAFMRAVSALLDWEREVRILSTSCNDQTAARDLNALPTFSAAQDLAERYSKLLFRGAVHDLHATFKSTVLDPAASWISKATRMVAWRLGTASANEMLSVAQERKLPVAGSALARIAECAEATAAFVKEPVVAAAARAAAKPLRRGTTRGTVPQRMDASSVAVRAAKAMAATSRDGRDEHGAAARARSLLSGIASDSAVFAFEAEVAAAGMRFIEWREAVERAHDAEDGSDAAVLTALLASASLCGATGCPEHGELVELLAESRSWDARAADLLEGGCAAEDAHALLRECNDWQFAPAMVGVVNAELARCKAWSERAALALRTRAPLRASTVSTAIPDMPAVAALIQEACALPMRPREADALREKYALARAWECECADELTECGAIDEARAERIRDIIARGEAFALVLPVLSAMKAFLRASEWNARAALLWCGGARRNRAGLPTVAQLAGLKRSAEAIATLADAGAVAVPDSRRGEELRVCAALHARVVEQSRLASEWDRRAREILEDDGLRDGKRSGVSGRRGGTHPVADAQRFIESAAAIEVKLEYLEALEHELVQYHLRVARVQSLLADLGIDFEAEVPDIEEEASDASLSSGEDETSKEGGGKRKAQGQLCPRRKRARAPPRSLLPGESDEGVLAGTRLLLREGPPVEESERFEYGDIESVLDEDDASPIPLDARTRGALARAIEPADEWSEAASRAICADPANELGDVLEYLSDRVANAQARLEQAAAGDYLEDREAALGIDGGDKRRGRKRHLRREVRFCLCGVNEKEDDGGVDMVCCDMCDQWVHVDCVGLTKQEVTAMDAFICPVCAQGREPLGRKSKRNEVRGTIAHDSFCVSNRPTLSDLRVLAAASRRLIVKPALEEQLLSTIKSLERFDVAAHGFMDMLTDHDTPTPAPRACVAYAAISMEVPLRSAAAVVASAALDTLTKSANKLLEAELKPSLKSVSRFIRRVEALDLPERVKDSGALGELARYEREGTAWAREARAALEDLTMPLSVVRRIISAADDLFVGVTKEVAQLEDRCVLHCVCRKPYDGSSCMILCDVCDTWFHYECVGLKAPAPGEKATHPSSNALARRRQKPAGHRRFHLLLH
eukprot:PRCOL_00007006-RA